MSSDHVPKEPKPDLLRLWMGEPDEQPLPRRSPLHPLLTAILTVGGLVAAIVLAKFAVDVLVILLALLVTGLVLHVVGTKVAESTWLSPGTFAIAASVVCLFAYAFLAPADGVVSLRRYLPKSVVQLLTWSEEHGWGHRALYAGPEPASAPAVAAPSYSSPEPAAPRPDATTTTAASSPSSATVSLSVSDAASRAGQPVILTARLHESTDRTEVRFYDGSNFLGTGTIRTEGTAKVAYLTLTTLQAGPHEFTAEVTGTLGLAASRSNAVRHTVNQ
jgi:hypothetical protein